MIRALLSYTRPQTLPADTRSGGPHPPLHVAREEENAHLNFLLAKSDCVFYPGGWFLFSSVFQRERE